MLGAALVNLGDDGTLLVVDGGHDGVNDVEDTIVGSVVLGHDLTAIGSYLFTVSMKIHT